MAKFTKYNNPSKRRRRKLETEYQRQLRESYYREVAKCENDFERDLVWKAYQASR